MKTLKIFSTLALICMSLTLMNFSCNDCEDEINDQFKYSASISPEKSEFRLNDTIQISAEFDSEIKLDLSEKVHDNSNQPILFKIKLFKVEPDNEDAIASRTSFMLSGQKGTVFLPEARTFEIEINNDCDDNVCDFLINMIPQEVGYFGIALDNGFFGFNDECQSLTLIADKIESDENNFELCKEINTTRLRLDKGFFNNPELEEHLYFFKVTE